MPRASRILLVAAAIVAAPLAATRADAACTIGSTGVAFGAYDTQSGSPDDGVGTINVDCHPSDADPTVALSAGSSGTFSSRTMTSGAGSLAYNLYTTSARVVVWGDGFGGSATQTLTGGNVSSGIRRHTASVYGRIPAGQNVGVGSYGDTITLTVTF
jgi:spore coat protein U domain-containing protein, fimbrial subunit CupE1/2/3/6